MLDELFEKYYREYFDKMLIYATKKVNNVEQAYDLVQEAFLVAWKKYDEFSESNNPVGWLYNALKYIIMHEYRARKYVAELFIAVEDLPDKQTYYDMQLGLFELSDMVSEQEWKLLCGIYVDNMKITEMAQLLNIPYETCKKRVQKARLKMHEHIEKLECIK